MAIYGHILYFRCLDLYFGSLDLYFECLDLFWGVWTCIWASGLAFWVFGLVYWFYEWDPSQSNASTALCDMLWGPSLSFSLTLTR